MRVVGWSLDSKSITIVSGYRCSILLQEIVLKRTKRRWSTDYLGDNVLLLLILLEARLELALRIR